MHRPIALLLVAAFTLFLVNRGHSQVPAAWAAQDATLRHFGDSVVKVPVNKKGLPQLVSWQVYERMGNRFVGTYLFGAADASLSKSYFALDNSDGRMTFGYNFALQKGEEQLRSIISLGAKANVSDGFAAIVSEGKGLRSDLGVQLKITLIGDPSVGFVGSHQTAVKDYMTYRTKKLEGDLDEWVATDHRVRKAQGLTETTERAKETEKRAEELKEELITDIVERLEEEPWYSGIWNWWATGEVYFPVTATEMLVADSADQPTPATLSTYPLTARLQGYLAYKIADGRSFLGTLGLSVMNNNSALAQELETSPFLSSITRSGTDTLQSTVVNTDDVYVLKDSRTFVSPAFEVGAVLGLFSCAPGLRIRVSMQQYLPTVGNEYTPTIWSLGLPLTLTDEDGDAKVNIEPQIRWLNGDHSIGFNLGVPLGGKL